MISIKKSNRFAGIQGASSIRDRNQRHDDSELHERMASLREGETRISMMGPTGALMETEYLTSSGRKRLFTVIWLCTDPNGAMNAENGDRILEIQY